MKRKHNVILSFFKMHNNYDYVAWLQKKFAIICCNNCKTAFVFIDWEWRSYCLHYEDICKSNFCDLSVSVFPHMLRSIQTSDPISICFIKPDSSAGHKYSPTVVRKQCQVNKKLKTHVLFCVRSTFLDLHSSGTLEVKYLKAQDV